jgi:hypothetical protein
MDLCAGNRRPCADGLLEACSRTSTWGDSQQFIRWSEVLSRGDLTEPMLYPLHQMYSIFLIPMHVLAIPIPIYVLCLHLAMSTLTVWLLMLSSELLVSRPYAVCIGMLAAVYPTFVFWMPYILTETQFLFVLSLFTFAFLSLLERPTVTRVAWYLLATAFLLLSRPVAFPIAFVSGGIALGLLGAARWGRTRTAVLGLTACAIAFITACTLLTVSASFRARVLQNPTIVQSAWLSTRVSSSNIDEILSMQSPNLPGGTSDERLAAYKLDYATAFIKHHPWQYVAMAAKRFSAFWFPSMFARWSVWHRLLDTALALSLTVGTLVPCVVRVRHRGMYLALTLMALSLSLLTAFSQIDSDGRYRLPAELLLLPAAPAGWALLFDRWRRRFRRVTRGGFPEA